MFRRIRNRLRDMATLKNLLFDAEKKANALGDEQPGVEHFLLSALDMEDGLAKRLLADMDITPDKLQQALESAHQTALAGVGLVANIDQEPHAVAEPRGPYRTAPSGQDFFKKLAQRKTQEKTPLTSLDVLRTVLSMPKSLAGRALADLGVTNKTFATQT